jgi:hypothetical protein
MTAVPSVATPAEVSSRLCPDCQEPCPDLDAYIDHRFEFHRVPAYRAVEEYEGGPDAAREEDVAMEHEIETEGPSRTRRPRRGRRRRRAPAGDTKPSATMPEAPPTPKPCWYCRQPPGAPHRPTCKRRPTSGTATPPTRPSVESWVQQKIHQVRDELLRKINELLGPLGHVIRLHGKLEAYEALKRELAGGPRGDGRV